MDFPGWRAEELWDGLHGRLCHPHPWDFKACWGKILSQCVGVESEPLESLPTGESQDPVNCFIDIIKACYSIMCTTVFLFVTSVSPE